MQSTKRATSMSIIRRKTTQAVLISISTTTAATKTAVSGRWKQRGSGAIDCKGHALQGAILHVYRHNEDLAVISGSRHGMLSHNWLGNKLRLCARVEGAKRAQVPLARWNYCKYILARSGRVYRRI